MARKAFSSGESMLIAKAWRREEWSLVDLGGGGCDWLRGDCRVSESSAWVRCCSMDMCELRGGDTSGNAVLSDDRPILERLFGLAGEATGREY
jgi:hypothetical protein